ncbi:LPS translocon maturation chaperone LptM [Hahella ganghwensis]
MRILGITIVVAACLGLLSCGQKGPLQLPQELWQWSPPEMVWEPSDSIPG